jgi:hypothetical protein
MSIQNTQVIVISNMFAICLKMKTNEKMLRDLEICENENILRKHKRELAQKQVTPYLLLTNLKLA